MSVPKSSMMRTLPSRAPRSACICAGTYRPGDGRSGSVMSFTACPCARLPCRGPMPAARDSSAARGARARQVIARAAVQPVRALVHRAAAEQDHRAPASSHSGARARRSVRGLDARRDSAHAGEYFSTWRRSSSKPVVCCATNFAIVQALADDDVHHRQGERGDASRPRDLKAAKRRGGVRSYIRRAAYGPPRIDEVSSSGGPTPRSPWRDERHHRRGPARSRIRRAAHDRLRRAAPPRREVFARVGRVRDGHRGRTDRRLARRYAKTRCAMILLGGSSMHKGANGLHGARAITCLPRSRARWNPGRRHGPRHGSRAHGRR